MDNRVKAEQLRIYTTRDIKKIYFLRYSRPWLLRISSAHAIYWSRATKYGVDDLCINFVYEYFCWMLGDSQSVFRQITSFSDSFHHTKKQKNLYEKF